MKKTLTVLLALTLLVSLCGAAPAERAEGFLRWEGSRFAMDYPENYSTVRQTGGALFRAPFDISSMIVVRTYILDEAYDDSMAVTIAAEVLPDLAWTQTGAVMAEIGGKNAAVITDTVYDIPMAFYVIGSGNKALSVLLTGEACSMAEHIIQSVEIKPGFPDMQE